MRKIILLTGDLACGKTTFSILLSKRYSVEAFNKDAIKEILADIVGFSNREENKKLSNTTVSIMTHIFTTNAAYGHDLILEANFHKPEIEEIVTIATENGYDLLILNLFANQEVSYERYCNRILHENRHPGHQTAGLVSFEAYCACIDVARTEIACIDKLDIDATTFEYQTDDSLLATIDRFMKKERRK